MGNWGWSNPPKHKHESKTLDKRIAARRAETRDNAERLDSRKQIAQRRDRVATAVGAQRAREREDRGATLSRLLAAERQRLAAAVAESAPVNSEAAESRTAADWLAEAR